MRKLLMSLAIVLGMTATASADYTFVVPQKPGGVPLFGQRLLPKNLSRS